MKINYQQDGLKDPDVLSFATMRDMARELIWSYPDDRLWVVLPGDGNDSKDALIVTSKQALVNYCKINWRKKVIFIQEFEQGDYADALGYLSDLFEVTEPLPEIKIEWDQPN